MKSFKKQNQGFTLIELMIAVAVIGVLAAMAYMSYESQVRRGNRTEAKTMLSDVASRLQRCFTTYSAYDNGNCAVATDLAGGITTENELYVITAENIDATTFTILAQAPAGSRQTIDDDCHAMRLNQAGDRTAEAESGADSTDECW